MELQGTCTNLRIFCGESDKYEGYSLYEAIIYAARHAGLAGATAYKGTMSFGASHSIHTVKVFSLSSDLPVIIDIIDKEETILEFLPLLELMMEESGRGGLVVTHNVEAHRYVKGKKSEQ